MTRTLPPSYDTNTAAPLMVPDLVLVQALVDHGMPRRHASALTTNNGLRLMATRFYFDVADAQKGNKAAKERVDYCRGIWSDNARREREARA